ncbi:MAG TPA: DUF4388 domain-containing protein [Desulfuromonadales bacterium]|nr:DUF4388 domain-containing protein [Desulfuromonadales bacterium]
MPLIKGDLGNFPIIDIIQLLNGSKKSGILRISGKKGECHLLFHAGDLVSANYLNNRVQIGQILVRDGALTQQQLEQALEIQRNSGDDRKPLVITLIEHNMIDEAAAYNGIESLIEMTIVEVLTWETGEFSLEIGINDNTDGYHFSKIKFQQRILLNAQGVLLESLRIFDEKVRNGTMEEIPSNAGVANLEPDLDLDPEQSASSPPPMAAKDKEQKRLRITLLSEFAPHGIENALPQDIAVIIITQSPALSAMVTSLCFQEKIYSVSSETIPSLAINIRLLLCQAVHLVIFIDVPHDETTQDTLQVCKELEKYPQASVVLIACARFWATQGLLALSSGIRSIIPQPCKECADETPMLTTAAFYSGLEAFLRTLSSECRSSDDQRFFTCISRLRTCRSRTEIADAILAYLIEVFERGIVFSVTESELVAEKSFGIRGNKGAGFEFPADLKILFGDQQIFEDVISTGQLYFGFHSDSTWPHELYRMIGRMEEPEVLLFPLIRGNTVVAVIYADFGVKPAASPSFRHLAALLHYTTAQLSVSAYRQRLKSVMEQMKSASKSEK